MAVYALQRDVVLAQAPAPGKGQELAATKAALAQAPLAGAVVLGDSLQTQREGCTQVVVAGGDDVFPAKENQPALLADLRRAFSPLCAGDPDADVPLRPVTSWPVWEQRAWRERGATLTVAVQASGKPSHGRVERRERWALTDPAWNRHVGELGTVGQPWPHVQQLWRLTRRRTQPRTGETSVEVTFGISSLPPTRADAGRHMRMLRSYWGIENRLHRVRDVTMGEDAAQIRTDAAPQVVAGLRNLTLALRRRSGVSNIAERLRTFAVRPAAAVALVLGRSPP